jgi:protein-disulfide isomerase
MRIKQTTLAAVPLAAVALLGAFTGCRSTQPGGAAREPMPSDAELTAIDQRVQEYVRKSDNLPEQITMRIVDVEPAPLPGLLTGYIQASDGTNTRKFPILVSRDLHYLIQGQLSDMTVDPFKAVMDRIALKDVPMRGDPNAAVTIVEYSDFQCPFCSQAYSTIEQQLMPEYGNKVRLVYKHFPLDVHPWAESGALAAACARQQSPEAFWSMYNFLFQNQQAITPENLKEKAQAVAEIDAGAFAACFDSKAALPAVKADEAEAAMLGVNSTPTFFINGRKLEGAQPYDRFKAVIDERLATAAAKAGSSASGAGASGASVPAGEPRTAASGAANPG